MDTLFILLCDLISRVLAVPSSSSQIISPKINTRIQQHTYKSTKSSGGYDDGRYQNRCVYIQPSAVSTEMRTYFDSPEWERISYWDRILHQAVNRSLDMTIDALGREEFEANLIKFRTAKNLVTQQCLPTMRLPCTEDGTLRKKDETDCLYDDMGCGFDCMDQAMNVSTTTTSSIS